MKLMVHEIPDSAEQLAPWLEQQLVGLRLGDLVAELTAFTGRHSATATLESLLGERLPAVLERGLRKLPEPTLRGLLQNPSLLLELQQRVFIEGGDFWNRVPRAAEQAAAVDRGWEALQAKLNLPAAPPPLPKSTRALPAWTRAVGALTAAALLVTATVFFWPAPAKWGFDRPGLVASKQPTPVFFRSLASTIEEDWTPARTADRDRLLTSLKEFRHGCDTLLAAPLENLPEKDRTFLKGRCQKWRDKIDGHIADLEQNRKSVDEVRQDAAGTVGTLIKVLRDEAAKA